ncbi:hypothetical protein CerSpe_105560 [Prunus speciosa]
MNASASAQEWRLLCFHGGYADDFEFDYHTGIRDKGGGLLGWIWWQEVRRFSHNPFRLIGVVLSVWTFATAACGSSIDFWTIAICCMLVGVGEASFTSLAAPFIDDHAPAPQKTAWLAMF